ncbi:MAG TPA: hypothetical protein PLC42_00770 [Parachlamydiaceae bacterium]|nr:hypothetical protein [Parachlamydiaceae bacterium]
MKNSVKCAIFNDKTKFLEEMTMQIKLQAQVAFLEGLVKKLESATNWPEKIAVLNELDEVKKIEEAHLSSFFEKLSDEAHFCLKSLAAIGKKHTFLALIQEKNQISKKILSSLEDINRFYGNGDGIVRYQINILKLILERNLEAKQEARSFLNFLKPFGIDLSSDLQEVKKMVRSGIENLENLAEIYPVGGAGERLNLSRNNGQEPLPVALLPFLGTSLLEGLIRDLQAREFIYYKLKGEQLITPIVLMASDEKDNLSHIMKLLEDNNWFLRGKANFFIFSQPMVPVVTKEGDWVLSSFEEFMLRPSGHGVIWKLAKEKGAFLFLKNLKKEKLLVRQINNPIAGTDDGLLGFTGIGFEGGYLFGFSSCERYLHASEGMDVLVEEKSNKGYQYKITNVEYTEFVKNGIADHPEHPGSHFSKFPANTNILFADIAAIEKAVERCPIPGMLINMKSKIPHVDSQGVLASIEVGRLESTMQNIADQIYDTFADKINDKTKLSTYLTYNKRNKTISVTKKSYVKHHSFLETPESCFYDMCKNYHELLADFCKMQLPKLESVENYLEKGPSLMMLHHPALGSLYSVIGQKIRGGKIFENAELQLEIAELDMENLELDGSLIIEADAVAGSLDEKGIFQYGKKVGKSILKNIKVNNLGIDRSFENCYWKNEISRKECLKIILHGNAEFIAEDVTFNGNLFFEVQDGERLIVLPDGSGFTLKKEIIKEEKALWSYAFDAKDNIVLRRVVN